ncbi:LOW QUALITY PROTEIN: thymidine kinase, partial [Kutzneria sp. 744]
MSSAPAAGSRRCAPQTGRIRWYFGPMDCGKSTLALQIDHNQARQGRHGLVLVRHDRSGRPQISSRIGISRQATEVADGDDLRRLVRSRWASGQRVDYLVVDEAQFLSSEQVEQLAELADEAQVDVYCFGIATDFRSRLFPGARRLFELADELHPVQVEVLCWCGAAGPVQRAGQRRPGAAGGRHGAGRGHRPRGPRSLSGGALPGAVPASFPSRGAGRRAGVPRAAELHL